MLLSGFLGLAVASVALFYLARTSAPTPSPITPEAPVLLLPSSGARGPAPRLGAPAPLFTARRFGGGTLDLANLRGEGIVMNFFASWCVPCRQEARDLEATYQKFRGRGVAFLAVDIEQDTWEDAAAFLKQFGISYPAVRDEDGRIAATYHMFGLPTTFFIDKDGVLRAKYVGPFLGPEGLKELERRIATILP